MPNHQDIPRAKVLDAQEEQARKPLHHPVVQIQIVGAAIAALVLLILTMLALVGGYEGK